MVLIYVIVVSADRVASVLPFLRYLIGLLDHYRVLSMQTWCDQRFRAAVDDLRLVLVDNIAHVARRYVRVVLSRVFHVDRRVIRYPHVDLIGLQFAVYLHHVLVQVDRFLGFSHVRRVLKVCGRVGVIHVFCDVRNGLVTRAFCGQRVSLCGSYSV